MSEQEMFKIIILDFDGVILESLDVKTKAFLKVYKDFPQHADEITKYHLQNGGVSRYKKFIHINQNILKIPIDENKVQELANIFSEAVVEEMLKCPFVDGVLEFLEKYYKVSKLYIASGTPENELRFIVKKLELTKYFKGIYGTPKTKSEIILNILNNEKISNNDAVFIGDAITDYNAAKETNIPFIARINRNIPDNPFLKMDILSVNDFYELKEILKKEI